MIVYYITCIVFGGRGLSFVSENFRYTKARGPSICLSIRQIYTLLIILARFFISVFFSFIYHSGYLRRTSLPVYSSTNHWAFYFFFFLDILDVRGENEKKKEKQSKALSTCLRDKFRYFWKWKKKLIFFCSSRRSIQFRGCSETPLCAAGERRNGIVDARLHIIIYTRETLASFDFFFLDK